jgi:PPOX class probable F420-dependent enzyme
MLIPENVKALVAAGPHAHLTTLNRNGSPQVSVVWIGIENNEFVIGHMGLWQKVKNVMQDARVSLSFLGNEKNAIGLLEYVIVYGDAYITEGGAADLLQRLAHIYLGPGVEFPPEPYRQNPGYVTRIKPTRFAGVGPWA